MSYGRMFASGYVGTTASTAAKELIHVLCSASHVIAVHEVAITGRSTSSEYMTVGIAFAGTTGVVGTTCALTPLCQGQTTCSGNVYGVAGSTNATGLTYVYKEAVNVLNGFHWIPTPECRPIIKPGVRLVVRRESIVATDFAVDAHIVFEGIG